MYGMKHKSELSFPNTHKLLKSVLIGLVVCLGLLCLYYGWSFGPGSRRSDEEASGSDGSDPIFGGFVLHRDFDDLHEDQEHNSEVPKSLPVCDLQFSELIPCIDRNLIYQLRLKPNLTLMEHYERHCPPPERRYNCLIPPPPGYKIPIRWPESRDEVWKANIPHTHLAQEKSDQNWMVVNGDKINFPGGGTHFHDGADKYIVALSRMLKFPADKFNNELDRLLRPGGYFVYTSPEAYAQDPENRRIWNAMSDLLKRMCWKVAAKKEQSVVWAKPLTNSCYLKRDPQTQPPLCDSDDDPDASWNVSMKACISRYSAKVHKEKGSRVAPWPQRLTTAPPRLEEIVVSPEEFQEDTGIWRFRVIEYWKQMKSVIQKNSIRNVMDMNSNLGGFAAALNGKDVWVMNVAPVRVSSRLKIIYDRGLIGTVHDWCEAFSTYPRTYDLLHAWAVFSEINERGCGAEDLLIEMDRILRPDGFVIIRDKPAVINYIRKFLTALKWDGWLSEVEPRVDALSSSEERVLIARKKLWDEGLTAM
ncbi:Methyltransf_29 domain-containing protein [Prunus yedoensis var. nudiflora]|uniref:Methyltransferase n=1 Tax=Prunus yedoensis var. nudiflora TaxID=2094558 RepID=A0A314Z4R7_PRUYE|nr:Methyltransf_29 domain-containing protein [Prunus yedoensis var. nudiflora]